MASKLIPILLLVSLPFWQDGASASDCIQVKEGGILNLDGEVIKTKEEAEDKDNAPLVQIYALIPDASFCDGSRYVPLFPSALVSKWFGKHVLVSGNASGDYNGWHINVSRISGH